MRTAERSIAEPLLASFLVSLVSLVACAITPILNRLSSLASVSSSSARDDDIWGKDNDTFEESNARAMALFGSGALLADACTHGIPNSFGKLDGGGGGGGRVCRRVFLSGVLTFCALVASCVREYVRRVLLLKMTMESRRGGGKGELEEDKKEEDDGNGKNHPGHTRWQNIASGGWLNLFVDGLHNFTDGVAFAMSF